MNATITRLSEERASQEAFIAELLGQAETESRDLVDTELRSIKAAEERCAEIDAQLAPLAAFEARRAAAVDISAIGRATTNPRPTESVESRSLGQMWTESDQFRSYNGRGTSGTLIVPGYTHLRAAGDPILTSTGDGKKMVPPAQKIMGPAVNRRFPLLDLLGTVEVSGNSVSWLTVGEASGADVVAEGTQKPPVVWTLTETPYTLETIAGYVKYSRQSLADIPALRSMIDQKIRQAIDVKINALAVTAATGAFTGGNTVTGAAGVDLVAVVREAIADLEDEGVAPSAILINPADAAAYDVAMLGKPLGVATVNGGMWGLPLVPVSGVTAGTAIVGDIADAITWFYKSGLEFYTTDSDISGAADAVTSDFRANILTSLGEVRGKVAVTDASRLRKAVFTPKP
jgi:HK97 family phage major capsid protein